MRLIDADALSLELYNRINQMTLEDEKLSAYQALLIAMGLVQEASTIDAVPVVRCKDCKQRTPEKLKEEWLDCFLWHCKDGRKGR